MACKTAKIARKDKTLNRRQKEFLIIFGKKLGLVTQACTAANVGLRTYYDWLEITAFRQGVEDVRTRLKDFGEGALFSLVKKENPQAVVFFNKCKNKDRGYFEKQEIEHSGQTSTDTKMTLRIVRNPEDLNKKEDKKEDAKTNS